MIAGQPRRDAEADDRGDVLGAGAAVALVPSAGEDAARCACRGGSTARRYPWGRRTCGPTATAGRRRARATSTGILPTVWTASVWNSAPCLVRDRGQLGDRAGSCRSRCWRASPRRWRSAASIASRSASGLTTPSVVTGHEAQRPTAARQVLARVEDRLVLDRAGDQVRAPARFERLGDAAEGEVVGLGAAGGPDDLGRLGADRASPHAPVASSRAALARCPKAWTLDALPKSSASASRHRRRRLPGRRGVVALWSK